MPDRFGDDPPSAEEYPEWHESKFEESLLESKIRNWYQDATDLGKMAWKGSQFWKLLPINLNRWEDNYGASHLGYPLMTSKSLEDVKIKCLESVVDKTYRWNVRENMEFPDPPVTRRRPSTARKGEIPDRWDKAQWYGPENWLTDFPDIFRTRLVVLYFDGVSFLADEIEKLAGRLGSRKPDLELKASNTGYHAAHVGVFHQATFPEYEQWYGEPVDAQLEIQVITFTQNMIMDILHGVYADSRSSGPTSGWEWDSNDPAFSGNYLGNTLHYLEGMIVIARDRIGGNR